MEHWGNDTWSTEARCSVPSSECCVGRGGGFHAALALRRRLSVLRSLVPVLLLSLARAEAGAVAEPGVAARAVLGELVHKFRRDVGLDADLLDFELGKLEEVLRDLVAPSVLDVEVDVPFANRRLEKSTNARQ